MTGILAGIDAKIHVGWYGIDGVPSALVPGYGPSGVATLALRLEQGYTLTWGWPTDIIPSVAGGEQRIPRNNRPQESFSGGALLFGTESPAMHAKLARFALDGNAFLLGLPHEALPIVADSSGTSVPVPRTDLSDWIKPGQRVIVLRNRQGIDATVQAKSSNTVALDKAPGTIGKQGGLIMPALPVYLDPEQAFDRYRTKVERWKVRTRAAVFGFARQLASLNLGPITVAAGLDAATVTARYAGSSPTFQLAGDGIGGALLEETPTAVIVHCALGGLTPTTVTQVYNALLSSSFVAPTGTWGVGNLAPGDEVPTTALAGGDTSGPVGTGAALTMYAGTPVWDRKLLNSGTNADSINGLTQVIDHGGLPYPVGLADSPIWGRAVNHLGRGLAEWQWLKLFMVTVRGPAKVFWLSTWRDDMTIVGHAAEFLTVTGDPKAWYPTLRQHIHVREANGSSVYCKLNDVIDNGDGTFELQTDAAPFTNPVGVSWLELCRFDGEAFQVKFDKGASFELTWRATAVPQ